MDQRIKQNSPYSIRKVFFLYPHTIIKDIFKEIIYEGYDAFMIEDHRVIVSFLKKYHHSILYINIDKILKDEEWLVFSKKIIDYEGTKSTDIGIMTDDRLKKKFLARKYLFDIGITCGYISLIPNMKKILEVVLKILDANEAKGGRKYVRARCIEGELLNFKHDNKIYYGDIIDISIAGMSCLMRDENLKLLPDLILENIQLKLQGVVSMVNGRVYGSRKVSEGRFLYVLLFDMDSISPKGKENIIQFICKQQDYFIQQESASSAEIELELKTESITKESLHDISDEQFVQDLEDELHQLDAQLEEIGDIIKGKDGNG